MKRRRFLGLLAAAPVAATVKPALAEPALEGARITGAVIDETHLWSLTNGPAVVDPYPWGRVAYFATFDSDVTDNPNLAEYEEKLRAHYNGDVTVDVAAEPYGGTTIKVT